MVDRNGGKAQLLQNIMMKPMRCDNFHLSPIYRKDRWRTKIPSLFVAITTIAKQDVENTKSSRSQEELCDAHTTTTTVMPVGKKDMLDLNAQLGPFHIILDPLAFIFRRHTMITQIHCVLFRTGDERGWDLVEFGTVLSTGDMM